MIIKHTALKAFHWMLDFAAEEKGYGIVECIRTDLQEMPVTKLREYGFKINLPKIIRDIDANGNIII